MKRGSQHMFDPVQTHEQLGDGFVVRRLRRRDPHLYAVVHAVVDPLVRADRVARRERVQVKSGFVAKSLNSEFKSRMISELSFETMVSVFLSHRIGTVERVLVDVPERSHKSRTNAIRRADKGHLVVRAMKLPHPEGDASAWPSAANAQPACVSSASAARAFCHVGCTEDHDTAPGPSGR